MKSQRGFVDSCGVQRAWREELKNVLIWSTGLSKEQPGRCLSSMPEKRWERRENRIPRLLPGATSRDVGRFSQKPRESPGKGPTSPAWTRTEEAKGLGLQLQGSEFEGRVFSLKSHTGS